MIEKERDINEKEKQPQNLPPTVLDLCAIIFCVLAYVSCFREMGGG